MYLCATASALETVCAVSLVQSTTLHHTQKWNQTRIWAHLHTMSYPSSSAILRRLVTGSYFAIVDGPFHNRYLDLQLVTSTMIRYPSISVYIVDIDEKLEIAVTERLLKVRNYFEKVRKLMSLNLNPVISNSTCLCVSFVLASCTSSCPFLPSLILKSGKKFSKEYPMVTR